MKNIIVTGATSYIAVALINRLVCAGFIVYAVIRPGTMNRDKIPKNENIRVLELDMEEIDKLAEMKLYASAIYHFAWEGVRGEARNNSDLQFKNYELSKKCIEVSIKMKIPYFIGIGSQEEYGITEQVITERTMLKPISEYGKEKAETYYYGMELSRNASIKFLWARIFSAYGIGENSNTLLMQCINKMQNHESMNLTLCQHMWDYTYVDDVAEALFLLLDKRVESGAYNISYGHARILKEFVLDMKRILKSNSILNFGAIPYSAVGPIQMNPDVSKLIEATEWVPKIDFETGIRKMI